MRKLFGTDGIRGKANLYPMDAQTAYKVGVAVGRYFREQGGKRLKVLIGRDTRLSGTMIEAAIAAGLCAVGAEARLLGVISTPGVAYLTRSTDAVAGVVISASHNPFVDNGIKIFSKDGFKLPDATELHIEEIILRTDLTDLYTEPHEVGVAKTMPEALELYIQSLVRALEGRSLDGLPIVIDCANGAAYQTAPEVLKRLGADVTTLGADPDGRNINKACGSLHPEALQNTVIQKKAKLGVAFDGDADRAIFVDAKGQVVDGDQIMAICAKCLKQQGRLAKDTLVATVMSNIGLERAMKEIGVRLVRTAVGDRYVVESMVSEGYNYGGEQSGHMIFLDQSTTGDGVLAALNVLGVLIESGKELDELASIMTRYPQVLKNLMVTYKRPLEDLNGVLKVIERIESELGEKGRVLVRYSGTENKARVMVEGEKEEEIRLFADEIVRALDAELN